MFKEFFSQIDIAAKIQTILSYVIKISLFVAIVQELFLGSWSLLFISVLALILIFLPAIIEKNYKINLPIEFEFVITIFVYATLVLGEKEGFYEKFAWWDSFLHAQSGLLLGLMGFLIVYVLYYHKKLKLSPAFVGIFTFSFSIAIGTVWEIFEFFMDNTFGLNMQKSGLQDTMWDLIIDCAGALIAALGGYYYVKGSNSPIFDRLLKQFFKENPDLKKKF